MGGSKTYYELALEDYKSTEVLYNAGFYNHVATNCQQAVEKFMKHLIVVKDLSTDVNLLRSHNLKSLYSCIKAAYPDFAFGIVEYGFLSGVYYDVRYPSGNNYDIEDIDAVECLKIAKGVKETVDLILID